MLGADQIGFHTQSYRKNFLEACATLPNCQVDFTENIVHFDVNRIRKALRVEKLMSPEDRQDRMSALRKIVASNSAKDWFESIIAVSRHKALEVI
jgi:trehalose-6-phosphate synthase